MCFGLSLSNDGLLWLLISHSGTKGVMSDSSSGNRADDVSKHTQKTSYLTKQSFNSAQHPTGCVVAMSESIYLSSTPLGLPQWSPPCSPPPLDFHSFGHPAVTALWGAGLFGGNKNDISKAMKVSRINKSFMNSLVLCLHSRENPKVTPRTLSGGGSMVHLLLQNR